MNTKHETFVKDLIKGKIAEIIFEQMFRESGKFTILHSGYEYMLPELAQYQQHAKVKAVMENIRNAPDFVLISQNKEEVHWIEVKYRSHEDKEQLKEIATETLKKWNPSWLFIASPKGFFMSPCSSIEENNGSINSLSDNWVDKNIQDEYLKLLMKFELE